MYLAEVEEPKRSTLLRLRQTILDVIPEAEEGISYGLPAFRLQGKVIAGFGAFKNHLSYLPHSGSVFPVLTAELDGYKFSSGALQFPIDVPLSKMPLKAPIFESPTFAPRSHSPLKAPAFVMPALGQEPCPLKAPWWFRLR